MSKLLFIEPKVKIKQQLKISNKAIGKSNINR